MTLGGGTSVMSQPEHRSKHMPTVTGEGDLYKSGGEKKPSFPQLPEEFLKALFKARRTGGWCF